jgi:hypothetical protein
MGYTCDDLINNYAFDCDVCVEDGGCEATGFECTDGSTVDTPEDCESCAFDWTNYGAPSCDAAWDAYGLDCATLEGTYGWDCLGCACPGDAGPPECDETASNYTLVVGGGSHDGTSGYPDIIDWEIVDPVTGTSLYESGCNPNYYGICDGGGSGTFDICLPEGFYEFYGYSAWGIGWMGATATFYNEAGDAITDPWTFEDSDWFPYGWGMGTTMCIGDGCGCTFEGADNYDPDATIDDNGSCIIQPGTDCESYSGIAGSFFGCGGSFDHCYTQADVDGMAGDGTCNAHGAGCSDDTYGWCHGLACEYFACDGGDCSQSDDPNSAWGCYEEPTAACEDGVGLTVNMLDSFGDGWNGNVLTIGDESFTIDDGDAAVACYTGPTDVVVTCDGGSWQAEVSWSISDGDTVVLSGGAPYSGCLGSCGDVVFGCTDDTACNYDETAESDDGSCQYFDSCGECGGDDACWADCAGNVSWINDGYCDGSNNNEGCGYDGGDCCPGDCVDSTYACADFGGDCLDCADPDSADNQEGGECFDANPGCTDELADNYNPDATTDDGSCLYDGCAEGSSLDCDEEGAAAGECAGDSWIGDGLCDGVSQAWGVNFCCYDLDGGDCTEAECSDEPTVWDETITGLTATGVVWNNPADGLDYNAIEWDWDDLSDGEEGCAEGYVQDCADDDCCLESWIGDGFEDCEDQAYGCDLTCYDDDGGDCLDPECGDGFCNGDETYDSCPSDCDPPSDDCADCAWDATNYGSECCDTAWVEYSLDCATLEANYGWDCAGCACPGDDVAGDDGGSESCYDTACGAGIVDGLDCATLTGLGYDCSTCEADGECPEPQGCGEGTVEDCSGDGDCAPESWVGDGWCDGTDQPYGYDLTCYDNDGGDCNGRDSISDRYKPKAITAGMASTMVNIATGEVTYSDGGSSNANRFVSYTLTLSYVDDYGYDVTQDFTSTSSDILIYGFGDGDVGCGSVVGVSTIYGSTEASEDACTEAGEQGPDCAPGDATGDGAVNVTDIVAVVGVILGGDAELTDCADINGDGALNVTDIVAIVSIILGDGRSADATSAEVIKTADAVTLKADGFIGAVQMTLSHGNDFSIELTNDAMVAEYKTTGNSTTLIIVNPQSEELFTVEGDYEVAELIVANSAGAIDSSVFTTPVEFGLSAAYPNPFNPTTSVALSLPNDGYVSVTVYNLMGQNVATLADGYMTASTYDFSWNASSIPSGMYFIRAEAGSNVAIQKVMLLK